MTGVDITTTRPALRRFAAAVVLACAGGAAIPAAASAATPDTVYEPFRIEAPQAQAQARFGERSALAGDIDGDGVGDFFMSAFQEDVGSAPLAGRVYLFSGRTRSVIRSFQSPEPQTQQRFGFTVSSPGDLSGDGKRDLVVAGDVHDDFRGESSPGVPNAGACGTAEPNGCYENTGQAWAFNGATGAMLYTLENPDPQSNPELPFSQVFGFGTAISSAGDITGDGRPDVLVGAASNDIPRGCGGQAVPVPAAPPGCRRDQGQAYVFNGATGALVRRYELPAADVRPEPACNTQVPGPGIGTCGFFGQTVQGLGDTDGDGVTDHLVQGGTYGPGDKEGRMWIFSGATGTLRLTIDNPSPPRLGGTTRIFGLQIVAPGAPGDVNNDGFADIYGNGFQAAGPTGNPGEGRGWIFSGQNGSILYNLFDPSPEPSAGFAFSGTMTDFDLDGREDEFLAGQNGSGTVSGGGASIFGVPAFFGPTAVAPALKDFQPPDEDRQPTGPPPLNGQRYGRTAESPGDLNQDGQPDYVIGAPQTDAGANADQGRVYVYLSKVPATPPPGGVPPPGGGGLPGGGTPPVTPAAAPPSPAKLAIARARVIRASRRLDVLALITARASGRVKVSFQAAGRTERFTAAVSSATGRVRINRLLSPRQARLRTGILTIAYPGDADTQPQEVRLRAASQPARLNAGRPTITNGQLTAAGRVSPSASGVVRLQVLYEPAGQDTRTLRFTARISGGRYRVSAQLSAEVLAQIAARRGVVHSYTLFTGYEPRRIRGEMASQQVLPAR